MLYVLHKEEVQKLTLSRLYVRGEYVSEGQNRLYLGDGSHFFRKQ